MTEPVPGASGSAPQADDDPLAASRNTDPSAVAAAPDDAIDAAEAPPERSMVLVAGSGRSGTSLFAGTLQRLGFQVPQPEVPPDASNPRGFAEAQWVVDFHTELLERARVQTADARPSAWTLTAELCNDDAEIARLRAFLTEQFAHSHHLVVKDPRLSWFMPMWRRCADDFGVTPRFVTMLRHPAAVVDSKSRYYGNWQGDVGRAAGWINGMLFTERATRESQRVFVRYDDLLTDWTKVIARVGERGDLSVINDATVVAMRRVHGFIDPSLSRSSSSWDDIRMPTALRDLCEHVWQLLNSLADDDTDVAAVSDGLDAARSEFLELYQMAEAVAQSSIAAAKTPKAVRAGAAAAAAAALAPTADGENPLTAWIPVGVRRMLPEQYRRKALRTVQKWRRQAQRRARQRQREQRLNGRAGASGGGTSEPVGTADPSS